MRVRSEAPDHDTLNFTSVDISCGGTSLTTESGGRTLCRVTGALFLIGALSFAAAATLLSATFDWPDILRQPADVVLTEFAAGGPSLVWTWFATAWTYGILVVPILLLPAALGRRDDAALWVASSLARSQPCSH